MFVLPYKHFLMIIYHFFLNLSIISCKFFPIYKFLFRRFQVSYEIKKEHQVLKPDAPFSLYDIWRYSFMIHGLTIILLLHSRLW